MVKLFNDRDFQMETRPHTSEIVGNGDEKGLNVQVLKLLFTSFCSIWITKPLCTANSMTSMRAGWERRRVKRTMDGKGDSDLYSDIFVARKAVFR